MPQSEPCSTTLKETIKNSERRAFFLRPVTEIKSSYPSKVSCNGRKKTSNYLVKLSN